MTGIDCVSFLALIQLMVAFDLGLFYLDEKHQLTKFYKSFRRNLHSQVKSVLNSSKWAIDKSTKSSVAKCRIHGAHLYESYGRLRNFVSEGKIDFDGWAFLGLYGGLYGLVCMFFVGLFKCETECFAQTYILICAQIIAFIQTLIVWRLLCMNPRPLRRNILHNTLIILVILAIAWILSAFDLTIKILPSFELPFVVSLIIIAMPILIFICYVIFCQAKIWYLKTLCNHHIRTIRKHLSNK